MLLLLVLLLRLWLWSWPSRASTEHATPRLSARGPCSRGVNRFCSRGVPLNRACQWKAYVPDPRLDLIATYENLGYVAALHFKVGWRIFVSSKQQTWSSKVCDYRHTVVLCSTYPCDCHRKRKSDAQNLVLVRTVYTDPCHGRQSSAWDLQQWVTVANQMFCILKLWLSS